MEEEEGEKERENKCRMGASAENCGGLSLPFCLINYQNAISIRTIGSHIAFSYREW